MAELTTSLVAEEEHKEIFRRIRNYLAGRLLGTTRDRAILEEVVKCLFCRAKIVHEGRSNELVNQDAFELSKLYRGVFQSLRDDLPTVFDKDEEILMDPESIAFVDKELANVNLLQPKRDPLGDLYEAFIGSDMRGNEGQFFTPQNAISWLVEAIDPKPGETIIDPACGAGGFLSYTARKLGEAGVDAKTIWGMLHGLEKDSYLAKLAQAHIALTTFNAGQVLCGDSLEWSSSEGKPFPREYLNSFDIVLTNPPFGSKIVSSSDETRAEFKLGYKWKHNRKNGAWSLTEVLQRTTPPQVLFIERCLELLKPGGRMGIVVPESLISSSSYGHVVQFLRENAEIHAVIGMPENLFKTSGKGGTHTKTCLVIAYKRDKPMHPSGKDHSIFMAEAKWCGHDSRGRAMPKDDLPDILVRYMGAKKITQDHLGYYIDAQSINGTVLAPRYYDPEPIENLKVLNNTHELVLIQDLVDDGVLDFSTGDEAGKLAYGTGNIPFVRTSDISNWEIKLDPKHGVSEEIYEKYRARQDVRAGDILMVRDGTYLIGSCAYVSEYDEKMVYQSHIYKIRVKDKSKLSPYLLLALLSCEPVVRQIKAKRFTQDIIDSIGNRVFELVLPIPLDNKEKKKIEAMVKKSIHDRIEARELAREAKKLVANA